MKDAGMRRTVGPGRPIGIRADSAWNVPEPEVGVVIGRNGRIAGLTIGNDVSSRDIEGANPLYLPQAKVYDGSCAMGPCLLVPPAPLPTSTATVRSTTTVGAASAKPAHRASTEQPRARVERDALIDPVS